MNKKTWVIVVVVLGATLPAYCSNVLDTLASRRTVSPALNTDTIESLVQSSEQTASLFKDQVSQLVEIAQIPSPQIHVKGAQLLGETSTQNIDVKPTRESVTTTSGAHANDPLTTSCPKQPLQPLAKNTAQPQKSKKTPLSPSNDKRLLVFVSFSMPEASLNALFLDAKKVGATLVMRGVYKNSFKEMQKLMLTKTFDVDIAPPLFEDVKIDRVPAFALYDPATKEADIVYGNITLPGALEIFKDKSKTFKNEAITWHGKLER